MFVVPWDQPGWQTQAKLSMPHWSNNDDYTAEVEKEKSDMMTTHLREVGVMGFIGGLC